MGMKKTRLSISFEWHSLLRDLLRNCWLVVLAGLIGAMGVFVAERSFCSPTYTSTAHLVIRAKSETTGDYSSLTVSADMTKIFAKVFSDSSMEKLAAQNLGLNQFEGTIETGYSSGVNLMQLSVTADDPEMAYNLLCSMLDVYPSISEAVFSNTVINVLNSPQMPDVAKVPISRTYRFMVIAGSMAIMVVLISLLSMLKDTVKHENGFEKNIDGILLETVAHEAPHLSRREQLARKKRARLIDDAYASLKFTEDYQKITTKLEQMQKKSGCKIFAVTSVAENEGKSTSAANIALALAGRGYRVLLVDMDVRKPSIYKIFGYREPMNVEFNDVLSGKVSLSEYKFLRYKRTELLVAMNKRYRGDAAQWLGSERVKECIYALGEQMDFVILDTPPLAVSADAASLINICDKTLLIVRTDTVCVGEINDAVAMIANVGGSLAGCILNDVYRPFTMFGQMGEDESRPYTYGYSGKPYGGYGRRPLSDSVSDMK